RVRPRLLPRVPFARWPCRREFVRSTRVLVSLFLFSLVLGRVGLLGLFFRRVSAAGRSGRVVGLVPAGALELEAGRRDEPLELAAAGFAFFHRWVAHLLHVLEVPFAFGTLIFVDRHGVSE